MSRDPEKEVDLDCRSLQVEVLDASWKSEHMFVVYVLRPLRA